MTLLEKIKTERRVQYALLAVILLFVLSLFYFFFKDYSAYDLVRDEEGAIVGQNERLIDGVMVDEDATNSYVRAVMIENLKSVRPQSGLSSASVVYEVLAEGGITRFMALFVDQEVSTIGPVRSARPYFVSLAAEYDALYAHAGGSPAALSLISDVSVTDLNQIGGDQSYFWRDDALYAPHNLFTKSELLYFALRDKEVLNDVPEYDSWSFVDPSEDVVLSGDDIFVSIDFSSSDYGVRYNFDVDSKTYKRENGGVPHVDAENGQQIAPQNVVVQYVDQRVVDAEGRLEIDVVGSGEALLFKEGGVVEGRWEKESNDSRTMYFDTNNEPFQFIRGQTWIEIVPKSADVSFS